MICMPYNNHDLLLIELQFVRDQYHTTTTTTIVTRYNALSHYQTNKSRQRNNANIELFEHSLHIICKSETKIQNIFP